MDFDVNLQSFLDQLPDPVWGQIGNSGILYVNQSWRDYTGLKEAPSPAWMDLLIHPDDREETKRAQHFISPSSTTARIRDSNGLWNRFQIDWLPQKEGWLAVGHDLKKYSLNGQTDTSMELLGKAGVILSESLDTETILKATAVLVLDFLCDLCLIDVLVDNGHQTKKFQRLLSMHRDVKMDQKAQELIVYPPQGEDDVINEVISFRKGRVIPDFCEKLLQTKAADLKYVSILQDLDCCSAIIMPLECHDKLFGAITLIRTSTRPPFSGAEINLVNEFSRRVANAMENASLYRQSQQAAEAKTQFLANISHEIRTPLGVILGFAELLQDPHLPEDQKRKYLEIILRNGRQLLELVGDLLDLSKIELGKFEIQTLDFSIAELIDEIASTFSMKVAEKKLKLLVELDPSLPGKISSDPLRIRQILINLIGNAIKFTPTGTIRLHAESQIRGTSAQLRITVTDEGIGVDVEKQKQLFQAFSQGDSTMTRKYGGAGLGLFLSRKLAQALGGDVELISSKKGRGSAFQFTLPVNIPVPSFQPTSAVARSNALKPVNLRTGVKKKILVVEDSPDSRFLISRILENEGLEMDQATNGAEAIQKALETNYDLILMDIQMPLVDGYTATSRLRKMGVTAPIVALTAHAMVADRDRCFEAGCNAYLTKPLNQAQFRQTIRSYL